MPANTPQRAKRLNSPISVLVADDHGIVRDGLAAILRDDEEIRVVATAADGGAAVREAERLRPRIVVLGLGTADGVDAARAIGERIPGTSIVVISRNASPLAMRRVLEAGALGYLGEESSGEEVLKAVRAAAAGKRYLGQGLAEGYVDAQKTAARGEQQAETLTATERSILKHVAEGKSNAEVAELIGLSARTVETYRLRLMRKLGIGDLASLVKYAIRHGITSLD